MKKIALWALVFALVGTFVFDFCSLAVFAAGFQWVYNNIEQGPNSQSNPKIEMNGSGSPDLKKDAASEKQAVDAAHAASAPANGTSAQKISEVLVESKADELKHWQLATGLVVLRPAGGGIENARSAFGNSDSTNFGAIFDVGYRFSHDLSASAGLGFYKKESGNFSGLTQINSGSSQFFYGGEAQFTPLHLGFLGNNHLIDLGTVGGFSTLTSASNTGIALNGGPVAVVNFSDQFAVVTDYRFSQGYSLGEAKLALRF